MSQPNARAIALLDERDALIESGVEPERLRLPVLMCTNTQCRVVTYTPHASRPEVAHNRKCPACYGQPS